MNWRTVGDNLVNKAPKIIFLIILLYALSLSKGMLFGVYAEKPEYTPIDVEQVETFYGQPVILHTEDSIVYEIRFQAGNEDPDGFVICGSPQTNAARGFGGAVPVAVFLDEGMVIRGVRMLPNSETRSFVNKLTKNGFFEQWNGGHLYDPLPHVDAFSGATYTSEAVIRNVRKTVTTLLNLDPSLGRKKGSFGDYAGEFAILFCVLLGLASFVWPDRAKPFRIPLLILTIGVLGIWQGAFVSLDLLYKWVLFGTSPLARFGIFAVVILAILLPLLTNKSFYCSYICPFGAAQELVGKLTRKKMRVPARILRMFLWIRRLFLVLVIVLLFTLRHVELASFEPFTVFVIKAATVSSIIIAILSLLASVFIQRPWCKLLCPTGEVLSILRRPVKRYEKGKLKQSLKKFSDK